MKRLFLLLFFSLSLTVRAATYYLAPTASGGSDSNNGTIGSPWFTLNKAWTVVAAGDIIYMRGGIYHYTTQQWLTGKNGSSGNTIKIWAYTAETPIISETSWNSGGSGDPNIARALIYFSGNYVHWKGIAISGHVQQDGWVWTPLRAQDFNNCTFELINIHHNGGPAYMTGNSTNNLVLNSDFHHNADPISDPGLSGPAYNNADGLNFEGCPVGTTNTIRGCRSWHNSDDGFDNYNGEGVMIYENCWSWNNGVNENNVPVSTGDGNGFKIGGETSISWPTYTDTHVIVKGCLSFYNSNWGYTDNNGTLRMDLFNCVAYHNGYGYQTYGSSPPEGAWCSGFHFVYEGFTSSSGLPYSVKNCVSFGNHESDAYFGNMTNIDHNSWPVNTWPEHYNSSVNSSYFVSIDSTGVSGSRQSNGDLPVLGFFKLVSGSPLRGIGTSIPGYTADGAGTSWASPPSLGAYEYSSGGGASVPTVTVTSVSNITASSATSGGNVTNDGGASVTDRGVCWNTSQNPTTANSKTSNGTGTGSFSSSLTGLSAGTTYYVRAYAVNSAGTGYSSQTSFNTSSSGTTYYILPTGANTNPGTSASPWATLSYACNHATAAGDIIFVYAGTYTDNSQCNLRNGVNIEGPGATALIHTNYSSSSLSNAYIITEAGSTASHISGIALDGNNLTGSTAIVLTRDNIEVYNCTLTNFWLQGIAIRGGSNNSAHNNVLTNSGGYGGSPYDEHGNINLANCTNAQVYNNTITQPFRNNEGSGKGTGHGMFIEDNVYGAIIHDNNVDAPTSQGSAGHDTFAIEHWASNKPQGYGEEFYNNTIRGEVDFGAGVAKGSAPHAYLFGADVHHNIFGFEDNEIPSGTNGAMRIGVQFEENMSDIIVRQNTFKNLNRAIYFCSNGTSGSINNARIYDNLFKGIYLSYGAAVPYSGGFTGHGHAILIGGGSSYTGSVTGLFIENNTMIANTLAGTAGPAKSGIVISVSNTFTGIHINNNIIKDFNQAAITICNFSSSVIYNLSVQKNILYQNGNSNNLETISVTPDAGTYVNDGGIKSNPLFTSSTDFHLQAGSPARGISNAGVSVSFTTDLDGIPLNDPVDIGAYAYTTGITTPTVTTAIVTSIITATASSGGNVTSDGSATVTARGVCWGTSANPVVSGSHTNDGTGTGLFTSSITGLSPGTTYHVRSYATNSQGTAYGSDQQFTTYLITDVHYLQMEGTYGQDGSTYLIVIP